MRQTHVQMLALRSLLPAEVAIAQIWAPGLWAPQTRSWRRPEFLNGHRGSVAGLAAQSSHGG
jgi:hypothetical protein